MDKKELVELFDSFLNHNGLWYTFKDWAEEQGYTPKDLGFEDED